MGCQPGAQRVQREVLAHWPAALYNAGCYNPGSVLDDGHTPSPHARGEAIDLGVFTPYRGRTSAGQTVFLFLHEHRAALGIVQLIWDGQIWSATNTPGAIRAYTVNPHRDHIHCQFTPAAARNPDLSAAPFLDGSDTMNAAQEAKLDAVLAAVKPAKDSPNLFDVLSWCAAWLKPGGYAARADGKKAWPQLAAERPVDAAAVAAQLVAQLGPDFAEKVADELAARLKA